MLRTAYSVLQQLKVKYMFLLIWTGRLLLNITDCFGEWSAFLRGTRGFSRPLSAGTTSKYQNHCEPTTVHLSP